MSMLGKRIWNAASIFAWALLGLIGLSLIWFYVVSPKLDKYYTKRIHQIALAQVYGDDFWAKVQTIEEAWPEIVSDQETPYYYQQLMDAAELQDKTGYSGHPAKLKPYKELTHKERLLLARRVPNRASESDVDYPIPFVDWTLLDELFRIGRYQRELVSDKTEQQELMLDEYWLNPLTSYAGHAKEFGVLEPRIASPISQAILAPFQERFSPGDAYCRSLDDKECESLRAKDDWVQHFLYPNEYVNYVYLYYRIYGEENIIAEGLYRKNRN